MRVKVSFLLLFLLSSSPYYNQSILDSKNCKKMTMMQHFSKLSSSSSLFTLSLSFPFLLKIHMGEHFGFFFQKVWFFFPKFPLNFFKNFMKHQNEILTLKHKYNIKTKLNLNRNSVLCNLDVVLGLFDCCCFCTLFGWWENQSIFFLYKFWIWDHLN